MVSSPPFHFKKFSVRQEGAAHAVGTDGILLGAWTDVRGAQSILDIGTGTGVVALLLAQRTEASVPPVMVHAVELQGASAACARENFGRSPWPDRLHLWETAVQDLPRVAGRQFDLIVSNPPYFAGPSVAPAPGRRQARSIGTLAPADLVEAVCALLKPAGRCCLILPPAEGRRLVEIAATRGLYLTGELAVRPRPEHPVKRLLLRLERDPRSFHRQEMIIYVEGETQSPAFRKLYQSV
jgi:tRNA1Val (adenine37-N6)-methyltransferase